MEEESMVSSGLFSNTKIQKLHLKKITEKIIACRVLILADIDTYRVQAYAYSKPFSF